MNLFDILFSREVDELINLIGRDASKCLIVAQPVNLVKECIRLVKLEPRLESANLLLEVDQRQVSLFLGKEIFHIAIVAVALHDDFLNERILHVGHEVKGSLLVLVQGCASAGRAVARHHAVAVADTVAVRRNALRLDALLPHVFLEPEFLLQLADIHDHPVDVHTPLSLKVSLSQLCGSVELEELNVLGELLEKVHELLNIQVALVRARMLAQLHLQVAVVVVEGHQNLLEHRLGVDPVVLPGEGLEHAIEFGHHHHVTVVNVHAPEQVVHGDQIQTQVADGALELLQGQRLALSLEGLRLEPREVSSVSLAQGGLDVRQLRIETLNQVCVSLLESSEAILQVLKIYRSLGEVRREGLGEVACLKRSETHI